MTFIPPGFLMASVEKLQWVPAPFQSLMYIFMF